MKEVSIRGKRSLASTTLTISERSHHIKQQAAAAAAAAAKLQDQLTNFVGGSLAEYIQHKKVIATSL
jgi:hypothetical protein